jgi:uncharacterized protein
MLRVNLSALADGPITTDVAVPADAPIFEELSGTLEEPLLVKGRLSETGADQYFWQGTLETRVTERCRRCLTSALPPAGEDLDLSGMVREELLLVTPAYVVCRDDCRGLCATCGRDLNSGDCSCDPEPDPRWAALEALKPQGPAKEG